MKCMGSEKIWKLTRFNRPPQKLVEAKPLFAQLSCFSVALGAPRPPRFMDRVFSDAATFVSFMLLPPCNYDPKRYPDKFASSFKLEVVRLAFGSVIDAICGVNRYLFTSSKVKLYHIHFPSVINTHGHIRTNGHACCRRRQGLFVGSWLLNTEITTLKLYRLKHC